MAPPAKTSGYVASITEAMAPPAERPVTKTLRRAPVDEANDPKIPPGTADFREHGGTDCRI